MPKEARPFMLDVIDPTPRVRDMCAKIAIVIGATPKEKSNSFEIAAALLLVLVNGISQSLKDKNPEIIATVMEYPLHEFIRYVCKSAGCTVSSIDETPGSPS